MFYVGQKVVCVVGNWQPPNWETVPSEGEGYTIRNIMTYPNGKVGFWLEEIRNPSFGCFFFAEITFDSRGFRPVVTTNIDIFTAMLAPKSKERVLEKVGDGE